MSETIVKVIALVPLKATDVAPVKFTPFTVTVVPTTPLLGVNELIKGAAVTLKLLVLVPVPAALVTLTAPVVAPVGTTAVSWMSETTVNVVAFVPLKATDVAPVKPAPFTVTVVPTLPLVGVNELIEGAVKTLKLPALVPVPTGLVTLIVPVVAPAGTTAVS